MMRVVHKNFLMRFTFYTSNECTYGGQDLYWKSTEQENSHYECKHLPQAHFSPDGNFTVLAACTMGHPHGVVSGCLEDPDVEMYHHNRA